MSEHTNTRSGRGRPSAGGGGGGRSQVTGVKMGKGAMRALNKNAECVDELLELVQTTEAAAKRDTSGFHGSVLQQVEEAMRQKALQLGRVTRQMGAGRLEVTLQNGDEKVSVPIAGTIKFHGRSNTDSKKERANTMQVGDVIVIRGSFASGKMSSAAATEARRIFERIGIRTPRGFFSASAVAKEEEEDADCGFEFDRSEELAAETAASAGLRAQAARTAALRAGTKVAGGSDDSESEEIDFDDI